jgi:hypothetical protein
VESRKERDLKAGRKIIGKWILEIEDSGKEWIHLAQIPVVSSC